MTGITAFALRRALSLREKIEKLEFELHRRLSGRPNGAAGESLPARRVSRASTADKKAVKRKMSAAARVRKTAAARARSKRGKAAGRRTLAG